MANIFDTNIENKKILFLSPYPGNAAFSCGGLLNSLKNKNSLLIATFFSMNYNLNPKVPASTQISPEKEELDFCNHLGAQLVSDHLPIDSIRSNVSEKEKIYEILINKINDLIIKGFDMIFTPIAFRKCIEHKMIFNIIYYYAKKEHNEKIFFYEELPDIGLYSSKITYSLIKECLPSFNVYYVPLNRNNMKEKLKYLSIYKSNSDFFNIKLAVYHSKRLGKKLSIAPYAERIYTLPDV